MDDRNVAELLKLCRERAKLSQEQLAKKLLIDQAIVSKVENGKIQPSYTIVKSWAQETDGMELLGMDFAGNTGWKKLRTLEERFEKIKDLVFYCRTIASPERSQQK